MNFPQQGELAPLNLETRLRLLIDALNLKGLSILARTMYQSTSGVTCVRVIIPEAEDFFLVQEGYIAMPRERGIRIIKDCVVG